MDINLIGLHDHYLQAVEGWKPSPRMNGATAFLQHLRRLVELLEPTLLAEEWAPGVAHFPDRTVAQVIAEQESAKGRAVELLQFDVHPTERDSFGLPESPEVSALNGVRPAVSDMLMKLCANTEEQKVLLGAYRECNAAGNRQLLGALKALTSYGRELIWASTLSKASHNDRCICIVGAAHLTTDRFRRLLSTRGLRVKLASDHQRWKPWPSYTNERK